MFKAFKISSVAKSSTRMTNTGTEYTKFSGQSPPGSRGKLLQLGDAPVRGRQPNRVANPLALSSLARSMPRWSSRHRTGRGFRPECVRRVGAGAAAQASGSTTAIT